MVTLRVLTLFGFIGVTSAYFMACFVVNIHLFILSHIANISGEYCLELCLSNYSQVKLFVFNINCPW